MDDLPTLGSGLRTRFRDIERRLESAGTAEHREALKREIIELFKEVDGAANELAELKADIRRLADRYKQITGSSATTPPAQVDHLGASTYIEKGWSLISLGDYAGALQALERALALAPDSVEAQSLTGWAHMSSERYDDALAVFSKVLIQEPANALARVNVGYICLKKGIFGEAVEHLSNAMRLDNDRKATLYAHYYMGLLYLERDMFDDATTFFRKTLRLGPNLIEAYYDLGRALWLADRRDDALVAWAQGQRANKFNPWAKRCQEIAARATAGGEVPRGLPV